MLEISSTIRNDIREIIKAPVDWQQFDNSTVLITGANGMIASYIVYTLLEINEQQNMNINVVGVVRNEEKSRKHFGEICQREDFTLLVQDVCDPIPEGICADYVIHTASQASAWHFENDPVGTIMANLQGTEQVLRLAKRSSSKSTLFISSLKVYGKVENGSEKLAEDSLGYIDNTSYKNCYAEGKRAGETLCACYHQQYGLDIKIVRPSYIYGASSLEDDRVWAQFIKNVVLQEDILLKSNGAALRSFCYVSDTVKAIFMVLLKGKCLYPYNISSEISDVTIRDFAKYAVDAFPERGLTLSFANKEDEVLPAAIPGVTPELLEHKRLDELGWAADVDIKEGIKRSVNILEGR